MSPTKVTSPGYLEIQKLRSRCSMWGIVGGWGFCYLFCAGYLVILWTEYIRQVFYLLVFFILLLCKEFYNLMVLDEKCYNI